MKKRRDGKIAIARRSRRDALGMIAAAAAGPSASLLSAPLISAAAVEMVVLGVFRKPAAAGQAGRAVLAALPASAGRATLLAALLEDLALEDGEAGRAGSQAIRTRISQRVRADFAAGRVRTIDGWVLSVTETHLYALASLASVQTA